MGKRQLPSNRMVETPIRFTKNQRKRLRHYQEQHDGMSFAAAVRALVNAGLTAAGVPRADELNQLRLNNHPNI